ncbi:hypothetical protein MBSD_n2864 [Mizugakiibacter sediminis]|uniref:EF-hand domain-containing protein n=1 Tax=Mizugakiibacter sediminis TaxID=1475481 RepID=A0A0K8QT43_9GAMM|nr:hypothetical protein MBSD_n2864 [Mizugakiibacter sediminis]
MVPGQAAFAQHGLGSVVRTIERAQKNFDIADKNGDGLLSREEAEQGPVPFIRAHFDAIDRAHRGLVSKQDVAAYVRSLQKRPATAQPARAASASS